MAVKYGVLPFTKQDVMKDLNLLHGLLEMVLSEPKVMKSPLGRSFDAIIDFIKRMIF